MASCQLTNPVLVTDGKYTFTLDAVQELAQLMGGANAAGNHNPRFVRAGAMTACANLSLPADFKPVCQAQDWTTLTRLAFVGANPYECEICTFVACTGC
ncbi:guanylin-like [Aplochiton taeniatus]